MDRRLTLEAVRLRLLRSMRAANRKLAERVIVDRVPDAEDRRRARELADEYGRKFPSLRHPTR